ncbi:hypothetical protein ACFVH4_08725 [Nocardia ignorata]|uniref:hypothetical protein n=1 Tax=Nocardia ignorata TaxID=145285 RepID=UPI00362BB3D0
MDGESGIPSPVWTGTIVVDPVGATPADRFGRKYWTRTLWAVQDGIHQGRITIHVYEDRHMVVLDNAETDARHGGVDSRRQGAGRALMDQLEQLYPAPQWWFAADPRADHSPEGKVRLMGSRCRSGRQWVHSTECLDPQAINCPCNPPWFPHDIA